MEVLWVQNLSLPPPLSLSLSHSLSAFSLQVYIRQNPYHPHHPYHQPPSGIQYMHSHPNHIQAVQQGQVMRCSPPYGQRPQNLPLENHDVMVNSMDPYQSPTATPHPQMTYVYRKPPRYPYPPQPSPASPHTPVNTCNVISSSYRPSRLLWLITVGEGLVCLLLCCVSRH